jgi:hypothetical protein
MLYDLVSQLLELVAALSRRLAHFQQQLADGNASDGFHTHNDLYRHRMVLHAHAVQHWVSQGCEVVKSKRHHTGEPCMDGEWFIVVAHLKKGQISYHYHRKYWDLFDVPAVELPPPWDGHTSDDVYERVLASLKD